MSEGVDLLLDGLRFQAGEAKFIGIDLVHQSIEKVKIIQER